MDEAVIDHWEEKIEDACKECKDYQGTLKDIKCMSNGSFPRSFSANIIDAVYGIAGTDDKDALEIVRDMLIEKRAVFEDTVKSWLPESVYSRNRKRVTETTYSSGGRCGRGTCCYYIFIGKD